MNDLFRIGFFSVVQILLVLVLLLAYSSNNSSYSNSYFITTTVSNNNILLNSDDDRISTLDSSGDIPSSISTYFPFLKEISDLFIALSLATALLVLLKFGGVKPTFFFGRSKYIHLLFCPT